MADRTVRAIFEARVTGARKGMTDLSKDVANAGKKVDGLTKDLKTLDAAKVKPEVDVKIEDAKKRLSDLTRDLGVLKTMEATPEVTADIAKAQASIKEVRAEIKDLTSQKADVKINTSIEQTQKRIKEVTLELGNLRTMDVTPQVSADIKEAQKKLRDARSELRELNGAKAELKVTADTAPAKREVKGLADDIGEAGQDAGEDAGMGIAGGILDALRTIPIAGAVVGVGVAIAGGLLLGIKQGLQVEAERDIFSAQTGLDEKTSASFGRAAGEAYSNAWGDSVAGNLDTARKALQAGIIKSGDADSVIEETITKLQGLTDLFDYDIAMSVQGVGNLMKTGLVKDADQAFDLITAASQKLPSDDLIETLNEYSNQFVTLGLSAEQSFGLIVQGAQAGARDTDIVADALKEMGLRIREGTDPAIDALDSLGLKSKDIVEAFQEGGPNATKAMDKVFDALGELEKKGGNTQEVIAALFGGPGEDLGSALFALNVDTAAVAVGGLTGAAGAADRALATMSDNAAAKVESARRNIGIAADGIKGALAAAFSDDIEGAADWVSKNRAPLMEFFLDVLNGTFDMARGFIEFSATALTAIADVLEAGDGFLRFLDSLVPGDQFSELRESLSGVADGLREGADEMRNEWGGALDEAQAKANDWAGPEILKARLHDATMAMAEDMDAFTAKVNESGGTVTINGDKLNAEQALAALTETINAEDGTVTINGDKVPAQEALGVLMALIDRSAGDVKVGSDTQPAQGDLSRLMSKVRSSSGSVQVNAQTGAAERALRNLERTRYATLQIRVAGVTGYGGLTKGAHEGGFLPGRHAGGRVPGIDPGYDNVLWPLNSGGRTLQQPLAGGEYVVNSKDAAFWAPVLELMNAGARPQAVTAPPAATRATVNPRDIERLGEKIGDVLLSAQRGTAVSSVINRKAGR